MEKNSNTGLSYSSLATLAIALALGQGGVGCARPAKTTPAPKVATALQNSLNKGQLNLMSTRTGMEGRNNATIALDSDLNTQGVTLQVTTFMPTMDHTDAGQGQFIDAHTIALSSLTFRHPGEWTIRVQLIDADGNVAATKDFDVTIDPPAQIQTKQKHSDHSDHEHCSDSCCSHS